MRVEFYVNLVLIVSLLVSGDVGVGVNSLVLGGSVLLIKRDWSVN